MKTYEITINNEKVELTKTEIKTILTKQGFKFWNRVRLQGGEIKLGIGSVKDYFKERLFEEEKV